MQDATDRPTSLLHLPRELLISVFEILRVAEGPQVYCLPWTLYRSSTAWLPLAGANRHLRNVACDTPTIWAAIDVDRNVRWLELALIRSANLPLDVMIHDHTQIPNAVELLLPHAFRIRKLAIIKADAHTLAAVRPLLSVSMPQLEVLQINTSGRISDYSPLSDEETNIDAALLPQLHSLHLGHVPFHWRSSVLPQLRRLALEYSRPNVWLLQAEFLQIIGTCTSLEYLKLNGCLPYIMDSDAATATASTVVHLPNLKSLDISSNTPHDIHSLLSHLALGEHVQLDIYSDVQIDDPDDMAITLLDALPAAPARLPILATATSAALGGHVMFECAHTNPDNDNIRRPGHVQVFLDPDSEDWEYTPTQSLDDLRALLHGAPLTKLSLWHDFPHGAPADPTSYVGVFHAFPALAELEHTARSVGEFYGILVALVAPDEPGCVLPRLRALSLVVRGWYDALLDDVRILLVAREQGGGGRLAKLSVRVAGRPRDDAVLDGAHEDALATLRGVVAGEVVYVDEQ
ncbi:hypothetical protein C8Q76DRAFT_738267 [Earliella scabrosa]|nr:hypothetical protein C8Q76DRAFT_738267 [Earliella scabrosa]